MEIISNKIELIEVEEEQFRGIALDIFTEKTQFSL